MARIFLELACVGVLCLAGLFFLPKTPLERLTGQAPTSSADGANPGEKRGPAFYHSLESAFRVSRAKNRPVLVIFSDDHCPSCELFVEEVCTHPSVAAYQEQFIWVHVNIRDEKVAKFHDGYPSLVAIPDLPTIAYFSPEGELLRCHGFADPDEFISKLRQVLDRVKAT
jgi:thioredoxin-related protein